MKIQNILLPVLAAGTLLFFPSCNQDIEGYDNSKSYIYFDYPYKLNQYGNPTTERVDSLSYSFALDELEVTQAVIKVPVAVIGTPVDKDREFAVEVVADQTTATEADWDVKVIENPVIKAGKLFDTLNVVVRRTEALKTKWVNITFRMKANENFGLGYDEDLTAKVSFSDVLEKPDWWANWESVFGVFCREKYAKWIEIYYEGADHNLHPDNQKPFAWNNMPSSPNEYWYPSTFVFIRILKQYFIDNEVYPDGDTSKPRVELP